MPGRYPTHGNFRPRLCDEARQADATGRFFLCARCRAQVLICSCRDRGNIYCEQECAQNLDAMCSAKRADATNQVAEVAANMPSARVRAHCKRK
jgi:hypothetical protein